MMAIVIANRKLKHKTFLSYKFYASFDGTTVKREASTNHKHARVFALGNYRNSPFTTGHHWPDETTSGYATEILDYESGTWVQVEDYPRYNYPNSRAYL